MSMRQFRITGADRNTGEVRTIVIAGSDQYDAAERAVSQHNLLVASVHDNKCAPGTSGVWNPGQDGGGIDYARLRKTITWGVVGGIIIATLILGGITALLQAIISALEATI